MKKYAAAILIRFLPIKNPIVVNHSISLHPKEALKTVDGLNYLRDYLDDQGITLAKDYVEDNIQENNPVVLLELKDIDADDINQAEMYIQKKHQQIISYLSLSYMRPLQMLCYNLYEMGMKSSASRFGFHHRHPIIFTNLPLSLKTNEIEDFTTVLEKNPEHNFKINLFISALDEHDYFFRMAKYWTFLESFCKSRSKEEVKELFKTTNISIPKISSNHDLLDLTYKIRNCVYHDGGCGKLITSVNTTQCKKWCKDVTLSKKHIGQLELLLRTFFIRYISAPFSLLPTRKEKRCKFIVFLENICHKIASIF